MATSSYMNQINVSRTPAGDMAYVIQGTLSGRILAHAVPALVFEKFGQPYPITKNTGDTAYFRRYEALDNMPVRLIEGVTPNAQEIKFTDLSVTLEQYGAYAQYSDRLMDTNDANVVENIATVIGEQAAQVVERIRIGVLLSGTNVEYANGTARADVNTTITPQLMDRIRRKLVRQEAKMITSPIASSPRFYTENVPQTFIAVVHPDLAADIEKLEGFKAPWDYGNPSEWEMEIGAYKNFRFMSSTMLLPFADAGGAATNAAGVEMLSTSGTNADVYPMLVFGRDAYGIVPLKGQDALTPMIRRPGIDSGDPLAQRGTIGWKTMQASIILNQAWMVRAEVAATA